MGVNEAKTAILENRTALGIEFGSTRIKAVLVDDKNQPIASGAYEWENQYVDGIWTYSLEEIWKGLQGSYQDMAEDVQKKYGVELTSVGAFGVSAMMHGYMPFNKEGELMVPFRTWRNNITGEASEKLAELFHYNIPQRWSIAHLYQAILNGEEHVKDIDYITTLEAYVHWKLTGKRVLGTVMRQVCPNSTVKRRTITRRWFRSSMNWLHLMVSHGSFAILCRKLWWQVRMQEFLLRKAQSFWM